MSESTRRPAPPVRAGAWLTLWAALLIAANASLWATGFRDRDLALGVEEGAARAETKGVGEEDDQAIRKAIQLQRQTAGFWKALVLLGDFLLAPGLLALRALVAATLFASFAALLGRPIGFTEGWNACARAQGAWAIGAVVNAALSIALARRAETSLALLLGPGTWHAAVVLLAQWADAFALLGWTAIAFGGWRRGQAPLLLAILMVLGLALFEAILVVSGGLVVGAGTRLTVLPD